MLKLARLADDVQSAFDELALLSVEAGIRRLLDLYERVLAFHAEVGGYLDAVEHLRIELPREFDRDGDHQRTLVLFTIYGMYLQVKTLCLLPMLQLCVWRALGRDGFGGVGLEAGQYVEGLADECVKTACETIAMFERHIAMYPHTPEVRLSSFVVKSRQWLTSYPSQLSLSSIFMLYAVSIVYMDVLRLPVVVASTRHSGHIKSALKKLEHYDHPAATLAEASPPALFPPKSAGELTFLICIWKIVLHLAGHVSGLVGQLHRRDRALTTMRLGAQRCKSRTTRWTRRTRRGSLRIEQSI